MKCAGRLRGTFREGGRATTHGLIRDDMLHRRHDIAIIMHQTKASMSLSYNESFITFPSVSVATDLCMAERSGTRSP